jgi:hypothetical protein
LTNALIERPGWEEVSQDPRTVRLAVPGGWIYRVYDRPVFVPSPVEPALATDGPVKHSDVLEVQKLRHTIIQLSAELELVKARYEQKKRKDHDPCCASVRPRNEGDGTLKCNCGFRRQ